MITCKSCGNENPPGSSFCGKCNDPLKEQVLSESGDIGTEGTIPHNFTRGGNRKKAAAELELREGAIFDGRYTIGAQIGRGGMGVVYRAVDRHGERDVALKLIRPDALLGDKAVERLIGEGVLTQELSHKNIVKVYNVNVANDVPYVAMQFVKGTTLADWQRAKMAAREQVPTRVAARIIMEVLAGLEAAHAAGVIHRDLKPQNIILTSEPDEHNADLQILDFGIARAAGAQESSLAGTALGDEMYMAPEQRSDPDLVDGSADLFALSKIFYKLLMDALPDSMWQPPSASRSDVTAYLDRLIYSGISVNRSARPQTVEEYKGRLIAAMNNRDWDGGGTPTPPPPRLRLRLHRHRHRQTILGKRSEQTFRAAE